MKKRRADMNPEEREAARAHDRAYAAANREKLHAHQKRWRDQNPGKEKARHHKQWREMRQSRYWARLLFQARRRAAQKGIEFDLTPEWALSRWTGKCEETGIEFYTGNSRHPFSASIDRKDNASGYTQANSRFVCWGYNAAKCCGTDEDVLAIAKALVARSAP